LIPTPLGGGFPVRGTSSSSGIPHSRRNTAARTAFPLRRRAQLPAFSRCTQVTRSRTQPRFSLISRIPPAAASAMLLASRATRISTSCVPRRVFRSPTHPLWPVRFAEALMPKVANGIQLDADLARARSENFETDYRGGFLHHRDGVIRLVGYLNHANMGNYREAIDEFLAGKKSQPDIVATRRQGRHKYGFDLNFEQNLTDQFRAFGRWGWNDGRNESFAYTEVDRTLELGGDYSGEAWRRKNDRVGAAFSLNAISGDHARYLALGGIGFLLGDGALNYGREKIFETYYTAHVWRGTFVSFDLQHVNNPGYNQDRGPVLVPGLRLHVDF